jgi:hypothetical protein
MKRKVAEDEKVTYGRRPGRPGLAEADVVRAAEQLLREGMRPTVAAVREKVGGSPSTVAPHLDAWWRGLGKRVAQGSAAFERIPAVLVDEVESLWLETLTEARARARKELSLTLIGDNDRHDKRPAASRASGYRDLHRTKCSR